MKIAFLGLGNMGTPMARRLIAAGHQLTLWNRNRDRAEALACNSAHVADSPAEAVRNIDAVITMLFDDAANTEVLMGPGGALKAIKPGALHIASSTISVALSEKMTEVHSRRKIAFVAAPVFGRPNVAEDGNLWIVLAGKDEAINRARTLLEPLARGFSVAGSEPKQAHALKLGGNFLISAMIHSLSQSFVYAKSQQIDEEVFFEAVNSALFQSPFYAAYAKVILHPPQKPGATIELGAKDLRLFREAASNGGVRLSLAEDLKEVFDQAREQGLGDADWAAGQYRVAQLRSNPKLAAI